MAPTGTFFVTFFSLVAAAAQECASESDSRGCVQRRLWVDLELGFRVVLGLGSFVEYVLDSLGFCSFIVCVCVMGLGFFKGLA